MAKSSPNENHSVNLLGNGTSIEGNIRSEGDFRIDGKLKGSIVSKGKIVIGNTGEVEGEIECQNADVSGRVNAKILVKELLSFKSSAKIEGDIKTGKLAIEPGAKFSGSCEMGNAGAGEGGIKYEGSKAKEKVT